MHTSKWLFLLLLRIKLLQDLKEVICLWPNLINWLSKFMLYGHSGYIIYVYTHTQVHLYNSLQFRVYFPTCLIECSTNIVAISEISDIALSRPWWSSLVCVYEVQNGSWRFSSSGTLMWPMKEHLLIFFFSSRNEGGWDQASLLCVDISQDRRQCSGNWRFPALIPWRELPACLEIMRATRERIEERRKNLHFWLILEFEEWLAVGTSLVAQWLRIRLPMQGTRARALVREHPTCRRATKPVRHNYWACAPEPASHNSGSPGA